MDIRSEIKGLVSKYPLILFMKGTPQHPMCAASARAVDALNQAGAPFHAVDVQQNPRVRAGLPRYGNWSDFPQLFVQGDLIGGCEVLVDLLESGELARMAQDLAEAPA
ncbi:MAG: glutaredoxin family protein [Rhodanobacteraceae bacterium]